MTSDRMQKAAPIVLRIGLALVFLWFGWSQLTNVAMWTRLIPEYATIGGFTPENLVYFNGAFEIVFGICLLFGFFTRVVSLLLALHMIHITLTLIMASGINAISVRDFGLSMSAISLFLLCAPHGWSIDQWLCTRYEQKNGQM